MADELLVVSRAAFSGHLGSVVAVAVTPDGEEVITTGDDGTARIWNRRTGEQRTTLTGHTSGDFAVAVTPDGEEVITTGDDGTIRIWNRRRGVQVRGTQLGGIGPARQLAAVRSDEPSAEDLLDFAGEVEMLAALAASLTTEPPLSVALLGEWGAGKSSFMIQMQAEVTRLADLSRNNLGQSTFAATVRQVRFNAWHYSDDHLWVGLIEHLFRSLAADDAVEDPDPASVRERRDRVAADLEKHLAERDLLNNELQTAGAGQQKSWLVDIAWPMRLLRLARASARQFFSDVRANWRPVRSPGVGGGSEARFSLAEGELVEHACTKEVPR